jgi:prepilin-type N-terminal cleavage/methylation domain-containing protein
MMNVSSKRQKGFTLVELMLSIAFLGVLMLIASSITLRIIHIYNQGVAMKQINQAGRALVEDLNRLGASGYNIRVADNGASGYLCMTLANEERVFVWNSLQMGKRDTPDPYTYPVGSAGAHFYENTRLVTLGRYDQGRGSYCEVAQGGSGTDLTSYKPTALLTPQVRILSVDIVNSSDPQLKKIAFWLGTCDGSDDCDDNVRGMVPTFNAATKTWACPGGSVGAFCAVSKYETVIYTPNVEGF